MANSTQTAGPINTCSISIDTPDQPDHVIAKKGDFKHGRAFGTVVTAASFGTLLGLGISEVYGVERGSRDYISNITTGFFFGGMLYGIVTVLSKPFRYLFQEYCTSAPGNLQPEQDTRNNQKRK